MRTFCAISILAVASLCVSNLALASEAQTFDQRFAKDFAKISDDCKTDKQPDNCKIGSLLDKSLKAFRGTGAEVSLIMWEGELESKKAGKSRDELKKFADSGMKRDEILPWIDAAKRTTSDAKVAGLIDTYRSQVLGCLDEIKPRKGDNHDRLHERVDACDVKATRASDVILVSIGKAAQLPTTNFRKSRWGDTREQVVRIEGNPVRVLDGKLIYKATIDGLDALAIFKFANDKLVEGGYFFTETHSNKNNFIDDYEVVDKALISKYGNSKPEMSWESTLYKNDRDHWGLAVAAGQMEMSNSWLTIDTTVNHGLSGDNYEITHLIRYQSIEFAPEVRRDHEARSTRDL